MKSVQTYNSGWDYLTNLKAFVRGGMGDMNFIEAVSGESICCHVDRTVPKHIAYTTISMCPGIVNRGCHNPPCANGSGMLDGGYERTENFKKVLKVLFEEDGSPRSTYSSDMLVPTEMPSRVTPIDDSVIEDTAASEEATTDSEDNFIETTTATTTATATATITITTTTVPSVEGDWTQTGGDTSLWCGETQEDATNSCGVGTPCPEGSCSGGLKCFSVPCVAATQGNSTVEDATLSTTAPSPATVAAVATFSPVASVPDNTNSPVAATSIGGGFDVTDTFFCGTDRGE
jgi:hypothetical protein